MSGATPITVAYGEGVAAEIMDATLRILTEARARLSIETIEIGEPHYKMGNLSGITSDGWQSLKRTRILLKAPMPRYEGVEASLTETIANTMDAITQIIHIRNYHPFINSNYPPSDVAWIRAAYAVNDPDITEQIIKAGFVYALAHQHERVSYFKPTHNLIAEDTLFDLVAKDYPQLTINHVLMEEDAFSCAPLIAPLDVVITPTPCENSQYEAIAAIAGSPVITSTQCVGPSFALFEALHAGTSSQSVAANPSGLLLAAIQMLETIGQVDVAERLYHAWLATIKAGILTADMARGAPQDSATLQEFTAAVIANLG